MLKILGNDLLKGLQPHLSITSLKAAQQWLDQRAATATAQHAQAMSVKIKQQEDPLEQQEGALRQTQLTEQAKEAEDGLFDEVKQLREVKARLEAENLEEARTEAALAAKVQALQQTKLQLEDDIRKASHANEVAETAKMAEQRDLQAEDIVQADQVEQEQLSQNSMDAPNIAWWE